MKAKQSIEENILSPTARTLVKQAKQEERERAIKIIREHLLTDWSGEQEVYDQIEQIAKKVEDNA